jgi:hypothetical protein
MLGSRRIRKKGAPATARVVRVEEESHVFSNGYRTYAHVLTVTPADGAPFETTVRHKFDIADPRPRAGQELAVRYDPKTRETVLDGDPRYDPDAMNARSAAIFASLDR